MSDPFAIGGPALVSFSGGRTSGLMLRRILDAGLGSDVHVVFANTGKERPETLDFVHEVEARWNVPIAWVERPFGDPVPPVPPPPVEVYLGYRLADYTTASRNGEPFAWLIGDRSYLPNPVTRFCTTELKIRPMRNYLRGLGLDEGDWTNIVGLRADEPRRVARMKDRNAEGRWATACPLYDAGVTKADVEAFWAAQPFDLQLRPWEGNCDLCFLKGITKRQRIIEDRPDLARWWMDQEERVKTTAETAALFRKDTPSYARLLDVTTRQLTMLRDENPSACNVDDVGDCVCGDWTEAA